MTTQVNLATIGRNLIRNTTSLRTESDVTVGQLAQATGVSERTLNRIEAARRERRSYNPMLKTVVKLAAASGTTVDEYIKTKLEFQ